MKTSRERRIFSPTRINNYNNFLKNLDDKSGIFIIRKPFEEEGKREKEKGEEETKKDTELERKKQMQMQNILKLLNEAFKTYNTPFFTGFISQDNKAIHNPDSFYSETKKSIPVKKETNKVVYTGPKEKKDIFIEVNNVSD